MNKYKPGDIIRFTNKFIGTTLLITSKITDHGFHVKTINGASHGYIMVGSAIYEKASKIGYSKLGLALYGK